MHLDPQLLSMLSLLVDSADREQDAAAAAMVAELSPTSKVVFSRPDVEAANAVVEELRQAHGSGDGDAWRRAEDKATRLVERVYGPGCWEDVATDAVPLDADGDDAGTRQGETGKIRRGYGVERLASASRRAQPRRPPGGFNPEVKLEGGRFEVRADVFYAHRIALLRTVAHFFYGVLRALCSEELAVNRLRTLLPGAEPGRPWFDGHQRAADVPESSRPRVALVCGLAVAFFTPDYLIRVPPDRGPRAGKPRDPRAIRVQVACGGRELRVPRTHDRARESLELLRADLSSARWRDITFDLLTPAFVKAVYDKKTGPREAASLFAGEVFDRSSRRARDKALMLHPDGLDELPDAVSGEAEMSRDLVALVGSWPEK